ncbi:MAG: hypothetical protein IT435_10405 [Phycisphaerales bacterium]|nr:hypothetical protein [Phycisphaerales bacterium]
MPANHRSILTRRRLLLLAAILPVIALLAIWLARFQIARWALDRALLATGISPATYRIDSIGLSSLRLSAISLGPQPWLKADQIDVSYTLPGLLNKRLGNIHFTGIDYTVTSRDGTLDWGYPTGKGSGPIIINLPIDLIDLADTRIHLIRDGATTDILLSGQITPTRTGSLTATLNLLALDRALTLNADIQTTPQRIAIKVGGQLGPTTTPPPTATPTTIAPTTTGKWNATITRDQAAGDLDLTLAATLNSINEQLNTTTLLASNADLSAHTRLINNQPTGTTTTLRINNLKLPGFTLPTLSVQATQLSSSTADLTLAITGEGWDLPEARISAQWQSPTPASTSTPTPTAPQPTILTANLTTPRPAHIDMQSAGISGLIESLAGAIRIELTPAFRIVDGSLTLDRGSLKIADASITDAHAHIVMPNPDLLEVRALDALIDDGSSLRFEPFTWQTSTKRIQTRLLAANLNLNHWLPIISRNRATGQGRVSGNADIAIDWSSGKLKIADVKGSLRADPSHGFIQVADADALGELLEKQDPRFATDEVMRPVRDKIISALRDFAFKTLTIDLSRTRDRTIALTYISGFGRHGEDPQGLNLTLDLHVQDAFLDLAARIAAKSKVTESAGKALEDFFHNSGQEQPR